MTLQPAALVFPDVELWATTYLRAALTGRSEPYTFGVLVGTVVPKDRADRMVMVRRDGGSARGVFDRPRISVRVWAKKEQDAADLSRLVAALLWAAPGDGVCVRMEQMTGPTPIADESKQPQRYQLFEATMRGEAL